MLKKTLVITLVMLLFVGMLPIVGSAADSVTLDLKDGDITFISGNRYTQGGGMLTSPTGDYIVRYTGGGTNRLIFDHQADARVVLDNVHIARNTTGIIVQNTSTATLILRGENSVVFSDPTKVGSAISVDGTSHVIIDSETDNDKLTVKGGAYSAGIGSLQGTSGAPNNTAQITINNGIIVAETGNEGAGIGGARYGSAHIVINGGNITARSVRNSAAIGAGRNGFGGSVTINGGVVYADASGGTNGAGIGGGFQGYLESVTITGGVVTAVSAHANIGGIDWGMDVDRTAHPVNLYISGGSVKSLRKGSADNEALTAKVSVFDNTPALLTTVEMPQDALGSTLSVGAKLCGLLGSHPGDTKYYLYLPATATTMSCKSANNVEFEAPVTGGTPVEASDWVQITKVEVTLTKSGENFVVGIKAWISTHKYQIWTYQKTQSEIFGGEGLTNQWVLSHLYTLGSDRTDNGFTEVGDSITRNIGPFNSVDSNYTVAVKVIDGAGNFVGQYKDTFTQAEAGEVVINKVTVDGVFADDKAFVKDIANDSPVAFVVTGNGVAGTEYTAKVDQTGDQLVASGAGLNEFSWNISGMQPGNYSVTLTASTADSSDSRTVNIKLYKNDPAVVYGEMTELVVTGAAENDNFKIDINPTVTGGKFRYRISEPWRGTIPGGDSELVEIPAAPLSNTAIPKTAYGVYEVQTFTYRDGVSSADDGAVRTVTNVRPGEPVTLNVTVDGNPAGAEMITKAKGTAIVFTPAATGLPLPQYSFWRRDANGWVLIRDYSGEGLTWTPNRVGLYTIQVRAKATGGLTYEVLKNIEFNINEVGGDKIADVANITINQAALDTDAKARTPILITANATSAEQDLLYKFIISNGYIYYVETAYSADPTYMWVPGKAGNYIINVLVKNDASFGKYDAVETFTVTVQ